MAPSKSQAGQKKGQTKASKLATKKRLAALKLKMTKKKAVNQTQSTVGQVPAGPSQVQPQQSQAQQCPPPPPPAVTSSQNAGDSDESETDDDLELDDNPYDFPTPDTAGKLYFQLVKFYKSASKAFGDLTPLGRLYAYAGYLSRAVFHCVSWATIFEIQLLLLDKDFTPIGGRKAVSEDQFREKYAMEIELFDLACERVPHLKKEFPSLVEVPELLFQLAAFLDAKVTSTRSEDIYSLFSGIFECVRLYLRDLEIVSRKKKAKEGGYSYDPDDDDEDIALPNFSSWTEKENRGFQNENIAPLLVPALMVDDYLRDRKGFVEKMRDGKIPYNSKTWPIYIWLNQTVDKSFMDEGLLMGELIGYVWQHIFLGPRAVGRGVPKRLRGQAKKWRIRRVTFGSVCYAAMLAHWALYDSTDWKKGRNEEFNPEDYYQSLYELNAGDEASDRWVNELLDFWTECLLPTDPNLGCESDSDDDDEPAQPTYLHDVLAQRRARAAQPTTHQDDGCSRSSPSPTRLLSPLRVEAPGSNTEEEDDQETAALFSQGLLGASSRRYVR